MQKFLVEFEDVLRQLKSTGVETDDTKVMCNLLMALPKSYGTVVTLIDNVPSYVWTYEPMKQRRLITEEEKKTSRDK